MANEEHLKVLKQGVEVWNRWREENPDVRPDFIGAKLSGATLNGALLNGADLYRADLSGMYLIAADLTEANLSRAYLIGANLSGANLSRANLISAYLIEANFSGADLRRAKLSGADLNQANLGGANLSYAYLTHVDLRRATLNGAILNGAILRRAILNGAVLNRARVGSTTFADVDLSEVKGLDTVRHDGPSEIGIHTLYRSQGTISKVFLQKVGVPDGLIDYLEKIKTPECLYTLEQLNEWIKNLQKNLSIVSRNLADRKAVKALHGPLNVPLSLNNEIRELEQEQEDIKTQIAEYQRLRTLYYS